MDINNLLSLNGCGTELLRNQDFVTTKISHMTARSASENSRNNAWNVNFSDGNTNNNNKYNSNRVRAVVALDAEIKEGWVVAKDDCCANKYSTSQCEEWRMIENWELWNLMYEICYGDYKPTTSTCFIVKFPSFREIFAAAFRDRVVQHWICLRLNPLFETRFFLQHNVSFNCRKGFGTLRAAQALKVDMEYMSDMWTKDDVHVGRFDIKAFFMHIDRNILWALLEPFIKENYHEKDLDVLLRLTKQQVFHCPQDDCIRKSDIRMWDFLPFHKSMFNRPRHFGMAIGNILSQLCANFYLSFFDAIMLKLCMRYGCCYKRFVDDFTIVGSKEAILKIRAIAERWLSLYLHLTLHRDKFYLQKVSHGCKFVGTTIMPHRTYLASRTYGGMHDQIFTLAALCRSIANRGATLSKLKRLQNEVSSMNSYIGFSVHHRSFQMRSKLYKPYLEDIRKVCVLNSDMGFVRIKRKYDYQQQLIRKEELRYEYPNWNYETGSSDPR